jgi:HK97 family phage major capsid protein
MGHKVDSCNTDLHKLFYTPKPVVTSPYMPTVSAGAKSIVFGDLSYYWLIERQPITIKKLSELYALQGQIGFSAYERLDGKLIQPDALKILQIKA